ncbi:hypothetical protein ACFY9N_11655 [Microbacterium sp. NPDC008134]|uniref:hypothetical protein n=1 Tax=Microbacterium sp. NPDC008134 TaxID=3364183 RepID=UPI0036EA4A8C
MDIRRKSGAAFSLPIPLDAMQTIHECIERVYGTGDVRIAPQGDQMQIVEPEDGWGPRKRGRGVLPSTSNDQLRLKYLSLADGKVALTVEDTQYTVLLVSEIARQWFEAVGGVNYVETKLAVDGGAEPEFVFTMQRVDGLTPADKAAAAESRVAELESELAQYRKEP